jgi:hypothetical protein
MTLTNVSDNVVDKSLFVRIILRKYSTYLTHASNVKKISTTEFISGIEFDKVEAITPVRKNSLAEVTANGHWYWDRDNFLIYFYYDKALTYVVLKIGLFVTTTFDVLGPSEPDSATVIDMTIYEGRMIETSFVQSCEDVLNGKLGINSTNINIINNDSRYNKYAVDDVSFNSAEITVWVVLNEFENRALIFKGICQNATFSGNNLTLDVIEFTKALQQEATFGDSETWTTINATKWPESKEQDRGKFIPMFLCGGSKKTATKTKNAHYLTDGTFKKNYDYYDVDQETDFSLKYVGTVDDDITYSDGKKYVVCRCPTGEFLQNFHWYGDKSTTPILIDAIANADITEVNSANLGAGETEGYRYPEYSIEAKSTNINRIKYLYPGMMVYLRDTTAEPDTYENMIVTFVDNTSNKFGVRHYAGAKDTSVKITNHNYQLHYRGPTVYTITNGVPCYLDWKNYYFMFEATDGGNNMIYAVVTNQLQSESYQYSANNETKTFKLYSDDAPWTADDVPDMEYFCRFLNFKVVSDMSTYTIGKVLNIVPRLVKEITTDSNSDTLVAGNSYYDFSQNMGSTEYVDIISPDGSEKKDTYLDIIEKILASSMAFMCLNADGKLVVRMFESEPYGSILLELTEDDIKEGSVISDIDFTEIASSITANPVYSLDASVSSTSDRVRRISGETKFKYDHYLKANSTYSARVKNRLESYKLYPIKKYSFTIINKGYELTLGDRINIRFDNSGKWLGTDTTKNLFIVKINKSLSGVQITAIENNFPTI